MRENMFKKCLDGVVNIKRHFAWFFLCGKNFICTLSIFRFRTVCGETISGLSVAIRCQHQILIILFTTKAVTTSRLIGNKANFFKSDSKNVNQLSKLTIMCAKCFLIFVLLNIESLKIRRICSVFSFVHIQFTYFCVFMCTMNT